MGTTRIKAGDRLTWTHYTTPGAGWRPPCTRAGTVWADAPTGNGLSNAWWVTPDEPLDGEELAGGALCAGRASGRDQDGGPAKGEVYSSDFWLHQPAALTASAARVQKQWAAGRRLAAAVTPVTGETR